MPAVKRAAPEPAGERRRSGRLSNTPKKSSYFESDAEESEDARPRKRGRPSKKQSLTKEDSEEQYQEEDDDDDDEGDDGAAKSEEEDDSELDEDTRPKVKIIPLEKLRDDGGVDYEDHKLHRNTMLFLKDLKANNKRTWLKSHDGEYRRAWNDWMSFVESTTLSVIEVDETIPELPAKDVIFRIYRDIRFSKDPTPYKPHFSAAYSRTGRKGPYAVYYIHCEPKRCLVAGGLWHPEKQYVDMLRRSIDQHPGRWRRALNDPLFKKVFLPSVKAKAGPEGAVKAFVGMNQGNALKKRPMDYEATHRDIELLKLRNYTVHANLDDELMCADDAQEKLKEVFQGLVGFVTFLNSVVMPDPTLDDDEDDDEDEDEAVDE